MSSPKLSKLKLTHRKEELNRPGKEQCIQESGEVQPHFKCSFGHFFQKLEAHLCIFSFKKVQICSGCLQWKCIISIVATKVSHTAFPTIIRST